MHRSILWVCGPRYVLIYIVITKDCSFVQATQQSTYRHEHYMHADMRDLPEHGRHLSYSKLACVQLNSKKNTVSEKQFQ